MFRACSLTLTLSCWLQLLSVAHGACNLQPRVRSMACVPTNPGYRQLTHLPTPDAAEEDADTGGTAVSCTLRLCHTHRSLPLDRWFLGAICLGGRPLKSTRDGTQSEPKRRASPGGGPAASTAWSFPSAKQVLFYAPLISHHVGNLAVCGCQFAGGDGCVASS